MRDHQENARTIRRSVHNHTHECFFIAGREVGLETIFSCVGHPGRELARHLDQRFKNVSSLYLTLSGGGTAQKANKKKIQFKP
jgi:hypothetical protein